MITFEKMNETHIQEAFLLALEEYVTECRKCPALIEKDTESGIRDIITCLSSQPYAEVMKEDGVMTGFLAFKGPWDGAFGNCKGVFSPLAGNAFGGRDRAKTASMLFAHLSEQVAAEGVTSFGLGQYAHDDEIGRSFVMNGFGIRCSDAIMKLKGRKQIAELIPNLEFCELKGEDRIQVKELQKGLTRHLAAAPSYFPTDLSRTFDGWFEREGLRVLAVKAQGRPVGFMALDEEAETFVTEHEKMINLGGTYVDAEFRGLGVANQLLEYVCQTAEKEGYEYLGVDCETLNPTALRFWNKYFIPYTYSYCRRIDERVIGFDEYMDDYFKNHGSSQKE